MPTSDMPSMANSLPRKMASTGTAAASTSITLLDFSSINWESSMPASRMVSTNSRVWPARAVMLRVKATGPEVLVVAVDRSGWPAKPWLNRDPPRLVDEQSDLTNRPASALSLRR